MIFLSALPVVFGCIVICAAGSSSAQICFLSDVHGEKQDTHTKDMYGPSYIHEEERWGSDWSNTEVKRSHTGRRGNHQLVLHIYVSVCMHASICQHGNALLHVFFVRILSSEQSRFHSGGCLASYPVLLWISHLSYKLCICTFVYLLVGFASFRQIERMCALLCFLPAT